MRIQKHVLISFFLALGYGIAFYILQYILFRFNVINTLPDTENLLGWDANWYHSIAKDGYMYWEGHTSNAAFFPLFPLIWKAVGGSVWGISFLNLVLFSVGFAVFNSVYKIEAKTQLLWLTIPSFYFVWIPYTEALFILLISLAMLGIVAKKRWLVWLGLFLVSLTRPTTMIMAPALLIMELIANNNKSWLSALKTFFVDYALPLLSGLFIFIWYQFYSTGVWFAFFKQEENWGHKFAWTTFPLHSMHGPKLLWLNAIALFLGLVALIILVKNGLRWLFKNRVEADKLFVLSCLYFTGISLVTLLFNPVWGNNSTNVYDIHRYALVSPFFWVLLYRFTVVYTYKWIDYFKILLLANAFWLLFAHNSDLSLFMYFNAATALVILYMIQSDNRYRWVTFSIAVLNLVMQINMFQWFLQGVYPG